MSNAISLDALRALDAIDRKGSFAAAAEALYKVPSALSYTIQKLETDLDVVLFDRSRQKAQLTAAGKLVLEQGRQLLKAAEALEDAVKQLETGWETRLTIAKDTIVPNAPIFELLKEFTTLDKMTEVTVKEEVLGGGWEALQTGQAQIAVGVSGDLPKGQYNVIPLGEAEFVFAVSPFHPLAKHEGIISAEQIKNQALIVVADSAISTPRQSSGLLDTRHMIRVMNMTAKIEAQKQGTGIGFLPRHLIQRELAAGELVVKPISIPRAKASLYLAWDKQLNGNALEWFSHQLGQLDWKTILNPKNLFQIS